MPEPQLVQPPVIPQQWPPGFVPQGPVIPTPVTGFPPSRPTPSPEYSPVIPTRPQSSAGHGYRPPVIPSESAYGDEPYTRQERRRPPRPVYADDDEEVVPPRPTPPEESPESSDLSYGDEPRDERYSPPRDEQGHPITVIPPPGHQPYPVQEAPTMVRLPTSRRTRHN